MASTLPPPPLREMIVPQQSQSAPDPYVAQIWLKWFTQLYKRVLGFSGQVTLTASVATTTVTLPACTTTSVILMTPASSAAVSVDLTSLYVVAGAGSFTIHHANDATAGRVFNYLVQV